MKPNVLKTSSFAVAALSIGSIAGAQTDSLPSWNDTAPKKAVIAFVEKITRPGTPEFVPEAERVAVFDKDGTLWAEQPIYFQALFAPATATRW